jgi:hypothetical protein
MTQQSRLLLGGWVLAVTGACSGAATPGDQTSSPLDAGSTAIVCTPGETQVCTGPGACPGGQRCADDGLRCFWAKSSTSSPVRFSLVQASTTFAGDEPGGTCCSGGDRTKSTGCGAHFGANITLTSDWTQYTYTWAQLTQPAWGLLAMQDPAELIGVQWQVSDAAATASFDVWVDALSFLQ